MISFNISHFQPTFLFCLLFPVGDKTCQNPGLSPILVFFSDLCVLNFFTLKILFLIFFEFCFWSLKKKFKVNVLIWVGVKLDKIWTQRIESKKKKTIFRKKVFFYQNALFRFNALVPNFLQFYSYTYQNIRYILLFNVPKKNSKKIKNKNFLRSKVHPPPPNL